MMQKIKKQINKTNMLDKYQNFIKISKTDQCSFYQSADRTNMQNVLIKRLQQHSTWDQLLNNRNLQYMNKANFSPKMIEIFKKKKYYFVVYQKPTGPPLSEPQQIGKMPLCKFYPLFYDLCHFCIQLKQRSPQAYILPQWVFINRNSCKIGHFQPFFPSALDSSKHVFMYNLQKQMLDNNGVTSVDSNVMIFQRKQSLIFNLGIIAYQLLTGTKAINGETEQQYKAQLAQLQRESYSRLSRITKDQKFAEMISNMLKQDLLGCPTLTQIYNVSKKKKKQYQPRCTTMPTVQLQMQKIQLIDKNNRNELITNEINRNLFIDKRKLSHPCCKIIIQNEQIESRQQKKKILTSRNLKNCQNKNRSFLPEISLIKPKYQTIDRISKPTMFQSQCHLLYNDR